MDDLPDTVPSATPNPGQPPHGERRRPGRPTAVNPNLIAILRNADRMEINDDEEPGDGTPGPDPKAVLADPRMDDLKAARALMIGLVVVLPFWGIIATLVWALMHIRF